MLSLEPEVIDAPFGVDIEETWFRLVGVEELTALGRDRFRSRADLLTAVTRQGYEAASKITLDDYVEARRARFKYVRVLDELLQGDALLVSPTMCVEGFPADDTENLTPDEAYNTQVANLTGHPAVSLPARTSSNEVPFGIQLMAERFGEDLLLAVGEIWERSCPWPTSAPNCEPFPGSLLDD